MNNTAVLGHPLELIEPQSVGLVGLPAEKAAQRSLPGAADNLLKSIRQMQDQMVGEAISAKTEAELQETESRVLLEYASLVVAFAHVASRVVDRKTIARLNHESYSELEAEIRTGGEACFGETLKERALATVWMLRKISDLLAILQGARVSEGEQDQDAEFARAFFYHAVRAHFYVDCLVTSMRTKRALFRDAFPQVDDGLRSIVNAYAWVKQAVDLRFPGRAEASIPEWTEDDQELL